MKRPFSSDKRVIFYVFSLSSSVVFKGRVQQALPVCHNETDSETASDWSFLGWICDLQDLTFEILVLQRFFALLFLNSVVSLLVAVLNQLFLHFAYFKFRFF